MSSRDELREALAEHFYVEVHGRSVASWSEVVVMENVDRTWHIAAVYRAKADSVLAVLDQQGWPQDCPTVEAAEPATPVGTASLLGTPQELLSTIEVGLVANLRHPVLTCNEGMDEKCFTCEALTAVASLRAALREAARYEQAGWLIPESECGDGVDPGNAVVSPDKYYGDERDVPLYRRVTTATDNPFPCAVCGEYVSAGDGSQQVNLKWQHYRCKAGRVTTAGED